MHCDAALLWGDVALHPEGMARGTEREVTQGTLAYAYPTREEARVIAALRSRTLRTRERVVAEVVVVD